MKKLFSVEGKINSGHTLVKEYVHAFHEAHAIKLIALRLQKKHPREKIFLEGANATQVARA